MYKYLWEYVHPVSAQLQVGTTSVAPPPRELHSAAIVNGNLFIFGGKSRLYPRNVDVVYSDLWMLQIQPQFTTQSVTWSALQADGLQSQPIPEGQRLFIAINGSVAAGGGTNGKLGVTSRSGLCIDDVMVKVR